MDIITPAPPNATVVENNTDGVSTLDWYSALFKTGQSAYLFGAIPEAEGVWFQSNAGRLNIKHASESTSLDLLSLNALDWVRVAHGLDPSLTIWGAARSIRRFRPWLVLDCTADWKESILGGTLHALGYQPAMQIACVANTTLHDRIIAFAPTPIIHARSHPSARYIELLHFYHAMHQEGFMRVDSERPTYAAAQEAFVGREVCDYAASIRALLRLTRSRTVLDYGAGKGNQYRLRVAANGNIYGGLREYWDADAVTCYEPGQSATSQAPNHADDLVVCTDVLEHIPEQDLPWVINEIFGHALHAVFCSIAAYPAFARLPDGENAHVTIRPPPWWHGLLQSTAVLYPNVRYLAPVETPNADGGHDLVWLSNFALAGLAPFLEGR